MAGKHIIQSGDMSGNLASQIISVGQNLVGSVHCRWTGTAVNGTLSLQVSNIGGSAAADWVTKSSQSISTDDASHVFDLSSIGTEFIRVTYTRTGGTGSMDAYCLLKVGR
jgi:hypothetical protein